MSTFWIIVASVVTTLLVLAFAPTLLGWLIYGLIMAGRIVAGIFGSLTGRQ